MGGVRGVWRQRGVRAWVSASTLDAVADTLFFVALGWAAAYSSSEISVSVVLAAGTVPRAVLMVAGGAVADRLGLALTANVTLVLRALLMVPFAILLAGSGPVSAVGLVVVSLLFGVADALHVPAMGALVAVVAHDAELRSAQSLVTTLGLIGQVVAAPVAGFLLALRGGVVGWAAAACLAAAAAVMLSARRQFASDKPGTEVGESEPAGRKIHELLAGFRFARAHAPVLTILAVFTIANLTATAPLAVGIPLKAHAYGWSSEMYAVATLGFAVGSALGVVMMERHATEATRPLRLAATFLFAGAGASYVLAFATHPVMAGIACLALGACFAPAAVLLKAELLRITPESHLGRVGGLLGFAIFGGIPVGFLIYGWLAEAVSIAIAGTVMATGLAVCLMLLLVPARPRSVEQSL